jgi:hypothetical protein
VEEGKAGRRGKVKFRSNRDNYDEKISMKGKLEDVEIENSCSVKKN